MSNWYSDFLHMSKRKALLGNADRWGCQDLVNVQTFLMKTYGIWGMWS